MTETILICIVLLLALALGVRLEIRRRSRLEDVGDEFADAMSEAMADDAYVEAITGQQPAFTYERLYRTPRDGGPVRETRPTAVLQPLPEPEPAAAVEVDEYLTGRAVRIIRRAEEERLEWHWDTLTGTWQPPAELTHSLDFDDWLRGLLEDREEVAA
jgi:hypothetical protein